jgi:hypothetical protein
MIADSLSCRVGQRSYRAASADYQYVYNDGSVNTELVTSAIPLSEVHDVLQRGCSVLEDYGVNIDPSVGAGCHQTISYGKPFSYPVVKNVIQQVRYYLPALLAIGCVEGTHHRGEYRGLMDPSWKSDELYTEKYSAVHTKRTMAVSRNSFDLLEFRYPDSHTNVWQTVLTAIINMAIIARAFKISVNGIVSFPQSHWDKVKRNSNTFYNEGVFNDKTWVRGLADELLSDLKDEISYFADFNSVQRAVKEITIERGLYMKNYRDIQPIALLAEEVPLCVE